MPELILLRHGQSEWNVANLFTGWHDVDLTAQGEAEARQAGILLRAAGVALRVLPPPLLTRAPRTP
ncbi:MAG: histidine phosphatase family protein, partial [Actinomycetes bacterium]